MTDMAGGLAMFLVGGVVMALLLAWSDESWTRLTGWWSVHRQARQVMKGCDLDAMLEQLLVEEGYGFASDAFDVAESAFAEVFRELGPPPGWEPAEPWDSTGWLDDAPREGGGR